MAALQANQPLTLGPNKAKEKVTMLDLPVELILQIINELDADKGPQSRQNIRNFRQTCKTISILCDPAFCRFIHLDTPDQACDVDLMLFRHKGAYDMVKNLAIYPNPLTSTHSRFEWMLVFLHRLNNLETLHIIGPRCSLLQPFSALYNILRPPMFTNLRECTLISHQGRTAIQINWLLNFPNLTTLKVSRAVLNPCDWIPPPNSSPLKHLALLDNKLLDDDHLRTILKIPTALQTLEWTTNSLKSRLPDDKLQEVHGLISILATDQPGLKSLKIHDEYNAFAAPGGLDFTVLTELKELSFVPNCYVPVNCFVNLPEGLETLRLYGLVDFRVLSNAVTWESRFEEQNIRCPPRIEVHSNYKYAPIPGQPGDSVLKMPFTPTAYEWFKGQLIGIRTFITKFSVREVLIIEKGPSIERRLHALARPTTGKYPMSSNIYGLGLHQGYEVTMDIRQTQQSAFELINKRPDRLDDYRWEHQRHPVVRGLTSGWD